MATTLIPTNNGDHSLTREMSLCLHEHYYECSNCGKVYTPNEETYLGKDDTDKIQYECANCSDNLVELYFKMQYTPKSYSVPAKDASLWRYMDFAKYVEILSNKALFFNSADGFEDKFEGALSESDSKSVWQELYASSRRRDLAIYQPQLIGEELEQHIKGDVWFLEEGFKIFRNIHCVNCLHENEGESVAMWDLYSKDFSNAIAIKTTYWKLYEALGKNVSIHIGRVNYIDYRTSFPDINNLFFYKRKSFRHENEVRAVTQDASIEVYDEHDNRTNHKTNGMLMPVDISILIEKVYISPKASDRLIKLINSINKAFGFENIVVEKSEINRLPC